MTAIHAVDDPDDRLDAALEAVLAAPLPDIETDDCVPDRGLVLGAFLRPHLHGLHPFLIETDLKASVDALKVLPEGARLLRFHRRCGPTEVLAAVQNCLMVVRTWSDAAEVWVSGPDRESVERLTADISRKVPPPPRKQAVRMTFWHEGRYSWHRARDIAVPSWDEVAHMYPSAVRRAMTELVEYRPPRVDHGGRLLLWHGPPGTGKTTAVRALCDAWREWARPHVVSDPEKLLNSGDYMARVLIDTDDHDDTPIWRLVIVEDAEELLRRDARAQAGAALGRLLNTADGLLGQGARALILLTTNERIDEMHPALLRPGRCLARIEFPAFDIAEATDLLGQRATKPMTLAEIMESRGELSRVQAVAPGPRVGNYL